jgi:hypothetical protein
MNLKIRRGSDPVHRTTLELLPWYVNGTLEGGELAQVEAHLSACLPCRRDLEAQRKLRSILAVSPQDAELTHALARMHAQLDASEHGVLLGFARRLWYRSHPLLRGALAVQLVVILGLAAALALRPPAQYRTLASPGSDAEQPTGVAVIFNDTRSEREVRDLLVQLHLRIVDGPTDAGAYTLAVDEGAGRDAVVAALRKHAAVKLALPVSLPHASTP